MKSVLYPLDLKGNSIESKLISIEIEILSYPLDLKGTSIESKLISIEILAYPLVLKEDQLKVIKLISIEILCYPLDLKGTSHEFKFWFCCSLFGSENFLMDGGGGGGIRTWPSMRG